MRSKTDIFERPNEVATGKQTPLFISKPVGQVSVEGPGEAGSPQHISGDVQTGGVLSAIGPFGVVQRLPFKHDPPTPQARTFEIGTNAKKKSIPKKRMWNENNARIRFFYFLQRS